MTIKSILFSLFTVFSCLSFAGGEDGGNMIFSNRGVSWQSSSFSQTKVKKTIDSPFLLSVNFDSRLVHYIQHGVVLSESIEFLENQKPELLSQLEEQFYLLEDSQSI